MRIHPGCAEPNFRPIAMGTDPNGKTTWQVAGRVVGRRGRLTGAGGRGEASHGEEDGLV